jgi:hypothetical protein
MIALAFATPAHADDQAQPPPLMVGKNAVIAPDEPDAAVTVDPAVAETDSVSAPTPEPVPVRVVATDGWKLAAKPHVVSRGAPAPARARIAHVVPIRVISAPARPVRAARPRHAVKHVRSRPAAAPPRWYQVATAQYRHARVDSRGAGAGLTAATASAPAIGPAAARPVQAQRPRTICELRLQKCLQTCAWIVADNAPQNGRRIGTCISALKEVPPLDRLHELLLQRLWSVARADRKSGSARQYQCFASQYQSGTCVTERPLRATASFGWEEVGAQQADAGTRGRPVQRVASSVVHVAPRGRGHVLAAVATQKTRARTARTVERPSPATREVAPPAGTTRDDSADWLLRSLVALIGIAMLAFLLAAASELPRPGTAVIGMRTRLASKGLSSTRIDLGRERADAPSRAGRIFYRD